MCICSTIVKHRGFSLLELMLALALSTVVLGLLLQFYLMTQSISHAINEVATMQEDLRAVAFILKRNISMAGYAGCAALKNLQFSNHTTFNFDASHTIRCFDSRNLPPYLRGKVLFGTDAIVVQSE